MAANKGSGAARPETRKVVVILGSRPCGDDDPGYAVEFCHRGID
jgi:hypothetical protein